jgi:hypothetical protein
MRIKLFLAILSACTLFTLGCQPFRSLSSSKERLRAYKEDSKSNSVATNEKISIKATENTLIPIPDGAPELSYGKSKVRSAGGTEVDVDGNAEITIESKTNQASAENAEHTWSSATDNEIDFKEPKNATLVFMAGLALICGVVIIIWQQKFWLGSGLMAGGCALFGLLYYPWIAGIFLVVVLIGAVAWFLYGENLKSNHETFAEVVVRAIEHKLPAEIQQKVKQAIEAEAGNAHTAQLKAFVNKLKQRAKV